MSKIKLTGNASGTGTLTIAAPNTNVDRTLDIPDAAGDLVVAEGGTFKINSSGNVGIGTSSPSAALHISSPSNARGLKLQNSSSISASQITFLSDDGTEDSYVRNQASSSGQDILSLGTGGAERMRIDSSGNFLVGTTSNEGVNGISFNPTIAPGIIINKSFSGNANGIRFWHNSSTVGSITYSNTATSYNTSSDYRLKTDVQPMTGATERLKQLKPVNFEWISSGERVDGFIAHEAQEVVPEAVTGTKDAMRTEEYEVTPAVLDDDGNVVTEAVMGEREVPDYQGIDQSKLVPLLVATIQEQQAAIEALTARVDALEAV